MLMQIRDYLAKMQVASNQQIAREFALPLAALEPMLEKWLARKVIALCQAEVACQTSCFKCSPKALLYYRFIGA